MQCELCQASSARIYSSVDDLLFCSRECYALNIDKLTDEDKAATQRKRKREHKARKSAL